jgi:hypothetical protein
LLKSAWLLPGLLLSQTAGAQPAASTGLLGQPGILITLVLILIPLLVAVLFLVQRVKRACPGAPARPNPPGRGGNWPTT